MTANNILHHNNDFRQVPRPPSSQRVGSPTPSESNSLGALDLTPKTSQPPISSPGPTPGPPTLFSSFGLLPPSQGNSPLMTSALSSLTSSVLTSTSFSPLRLAVGPAGNYCLCICIFSKAAVFNFKISCRHFQCAEILPVTSASKRSHAIQL